MMEEEMKLTEDSSLVKGQLLAIIEKLMEAIRNEGGRFLQQDNVGCWVEVDEEAVHEKVGRAFRAFRTRWGSSKQKS